MAKKKRVRSSAPNPNKPLFIRLEGTELTNAIRNNEDNAYAGPKCPHPNHGGYSTVKHIDIAWYKQELDSVLQGTAPLLQPCSPGAWQRLLKFFVRNDGYANDPAYGQNVSTETGVVFWKRDLRAECERGLSPPNHPRGALPGVNY